MVMSTYVVDGALHAAQAQKISGHYFLKMDPVLVSEEVAYEARFDITEHIQNLKNVTITSARVSFTFDDNDDWVLKEKRRPLAPVGDVRQVNAGGVFNEPRLEVEERFRQVVEINRTSAPEVAIINIGDDILYTGTNRRRYQKEVERGEVRSFMGIRTDSIHADGPYYVYHLIDRSRIDVLDGFTGPFQVTDKMLGIGALRDLADDGILPFRLKAEQGDYLFTGASVAFTGYHTPEDAGHNERGGYFYLIFGGLLSLTMTGAFWAQSRQRKQEKRVKSGFKRTFQ